MIDKLVGKQEKNHGFIFFLLLLLFDHGERMSMISGDPTLGETNISRNKKQSTSKNSHTERNRFVCVSLSLSPSLCARQVSRTVG